MPAPRFSVVIPAFNRATLLPAAMRSVLAQTGTDFELVVVDDGSTDGTADVVDAFDDPRIRFHTQANAGVSAARNAGAELAHGEFLVFLDSDDVLLPCALERLAETVDHEPGCAFVSAGWIQVSADRRDWTTHIPELEGRPGLRRGAFLPGAFAIRTAVFRAMGGYDPELRFAENTALGWEVRQALHTGGGTICVLREPLVIRYSGADRSYDTARYDAARRILDHHADALESPVTSARPPRKRRSTYLAIAGVSAARLGRRSESLRFTASAFKNDPSLTRLRNLLTVIRAATTRRTPTEPTRPAEPAVAPATEATRSPGHIHAVLVTFDRPAKLAEMVAKLPADALASLTIIDNAPSEASKHAAYSASATGPPLTYVPMPENSGPAGGIATGMDRVLATAADDDWILVLDDDELTASVETMHQLRDFGVWLLERGAPVGAVGVVGARFDRRSGRILRLADDELAGPVTVDYVAGGQFLMMRVAAAREIGGFDPALFFAFDDLDWCLRLARGGYGVYVWGPACLENRKKWGRLGPSTGRAVRRETPWRRYYAVRNHIVIMRRYTSAPRAFVATIAHLFVRPVSDLVKRRTGWFAVVAAGSRGCLDAWTGRLGRRVEPPHGE